MKQSKRFVVYFIISLFFALAYYFIVKKIIFSIIVFVLFLILFFILVEIKFRKFLNIKNKTKESFNFINNFIITYSVNNSISTTLESLSNGFSEELNEQLSLLNNLTDEEKVFYLSNYFETINYIVFVNLLKQHLMQGGDIIQYSKILLFDLQIENEELDNFLAISKQKLIQFCSMWAICFAILICIQFFMKDYFVKIQNMNYFPYGVLVFFLVFGVSLYLVLNNMYDLNFIDRNVENEK